MDSKVILKKTGRSSLDALELTGGFIATNAVAKMAKVGTSMLGAFMIFIVGLGIAVFTPELGKGYITETLAPNLAKGAMVYGGIKLLNNASADVVDSGIKGLGAIPIPEGLKQTLREWIPQISNPTASTLKGYWNNQRIELQPQPDGSYAMKGLGNADDPVYLPELTPQMSGLGVAPDGTSLYIQV